MDVRGGKKISNDSPLISYYGSKSNSKFPLDELIVGEIWSRLPVKSLIRFKCVCKNWMVDIGKKDRYFIDLHFERSKSRHSSFLLLTAYVSRFTALCLWSTPFKEVGTVGNPQSLIPFTGEIYRMFSIVNGLICFIDNQRHSVCIYNPSTRELTPWFKSIIEQQKEVEFINENVTVNYKSRFSQIQCAFGYDHASREYKVISLWTEKIYKHGELRSEDNICCEVLTVCGKQQEQNTRQWRRIDAVPPIAAGKHWKDVYANGSIYWLHTTKGDSEPVLVKFNVGNETFEVIPLPNFIINDINEKYCINSMEVDGHFSLLVKKIKGDLDYSRTWSEKSNIEVNLYVLYDDADCSVDYCWKEEMFTLPPFDNWTDLIRIDSIIPIPGTDLFIIRCFGSWSFYVYNWKKKTLSNNKFQVPLSNDLLAQKHPNQIFFYAYVENFLPLN